MIKRDKQWEDILTVMLLSIPSYGVNLNGAWEELDKIIDTIEQTQNTSQGPGESDKVAMLRDYISFYVGKMKDSSVCAQYHIVMKPEVSGLRSEASFLH